MTQPDSTYKARIEALAQEIYNRAMQMVNPDDMENLAFLEEIRELMNLQPCTVTTASDMEVSNIDIFGDDDFDMSEAFDDKSQNPFKNAKAHDFFDMLTSIRKKLFHG